MVTINFRLGVKHIRVDSGTVLCGETPIAYLSKDVVDHKLIEEDKQVTGAVLVSAVDGTGNFEVCILSRDGNQIKSAVIPMSLPDEFGAQDRSQIIRESNLKIDGPWITAVVAGSGNGQTLNVRPVPRATAH